MIAWKSAVVRAARDLSCRLTSKTVRRSLARAIERTRAESQDRAFLATKPGRFCGPLPARRVTDD